MIVLETERLVLRHLTLNDAPFILELLNEPSFLRFIGDRKVRNLQDARLYILHGPIASYEKNGFGLFLAFLKESGDPIGMCGLLKRETLPEVDIGFALMPAYWRQGYISEAATAILVYGRDHLALKRILAITSSDNVASIRVLEKSGLKFEGMIKMPDDARDVKLFAIAL
ncbi:MAG: GNAT family N-acetyltransferase [Vicinamibacteria bacterium]